MAQVFEMFEPKKREYNDWVRDNVPKEWLTNELPLRKWFDAQVENDALWAIIRGMERHAAAAAAKLGELVTVDRSRKAKP